MFTVGPKLTDTYIPLSASSLVHSWTPSDTTNCFLIWIEDRYTKFIFKLAEAIERAFVLCAIKKTGQCLNFSRTILSWEFATNFSLFPLKIIRKGSIFVLILFSVATTFFLFKSIVLAFILFSLKMSMLKIWQG